MPTPPDDPALTDDERYALDHAWAWFSLHANQRMQVTNFYLIALAFLSTAYVNALGDGATRVAAGVALAGMVVSIGFILLDRRTRQLVRIAEEALVELQARLAAATTSPIELVSAAAAPQRLVVHYSRLLSSLGIVASAGFAVAFIYSASR